MLPPEIRAPEPDWTLLQARIGYTFRQIKWLRQALTHSSYGPRHNERLEFLGDSFLNNIVGLWLYQRFPDAEEGLLTRLRSHWVNSRFLSQLAQTFHLGDFLRVGPGERKMQGQYRPAVLADALEALVAAIYLDSDFTTLSNCMQVWYAPYWAALLQSVQTPLIVKDPKTVLQECLQAQHVSLPVYHVVAQTGEGHETCFRVACHLTEWELSTEGQHRSKRGAEQQAARRMICHLQDTGRLLLPVHLPDWPEEDIV